ncbi:hypothetical protein RCL1_006636 [Eukaryota sp. TZLM3-RCL]
MAQAVSALNPYSEVVKRGSALVLNVTAARGLAEVLRSNLGPRGTLKMLVSGAGEIKLTKDGSVLLSEMQIQLPVAQMIARTASAQDAVTGDGTTSTILLIGEVLKIAERSMAENVHPRLLTEGIEKASKFALDFLEKYAIPLDNFREQIVSVAKTSLRTKLYGEMADRMAEIVSDAVLSIRSDETPTDLHLIEIMLMEHRLDVDSKLIKGLVMDHGSRHPDMPKKLTNAFVLTCNLSLEYEKSEVNSGFIYSSGAQRDALVMAERRFTDQKVRAIIDLKREVCKNGEGFIVINQKGVDPLSLDMFAKEGIVALRRAKRRNMERLTRMCGGVAVHGIEDLTPSCLGRAGLIYEETLGEEKFTFIEEVPYPDSCTILVKGPNKHTLAQIKEAIRDGLRAVKNAFEDKSLVPGAGAFFLAANQALHEYKKTLKGRVKRGVEVFADSLLVIPKTLAQNSGFDAEETLLNLQEELEAGGIVGLDVHSGEACDPSALGIWDNYCVLRSLIRSAAVISSQLLLCDEIIAAGRSLTMQGQAAEQGQ